MHRRLTLLRQDALNALWGVLMGAANIIPGVSGGTVALITGIYGRLVTAISHVDLELADHVRHRRWREAAEHLDVRFLAALAVGITVGTLGLASVMNYLLEQHRAATYSVFFGLILGSSFLVFRLVRRWTVWCGVWLAASLVAAFVVVGLPTLSSPPEGLAYIFLCGVLGICAMILPGISGAFILLVLGRYEYITGLLRDFLHGQLTLHGLVTIVVFCAGCGIGLLAFARFLRWLLTRFESETLAALVGLMLGSLRKLWPFPQGLPEQWNQSVAGCAVLCLSALAAVVLLEYLATRHTANGGEATDDESAAAS